MKIMRVLGLAALIIVLKFLVPRLFVGFENALLAFFDVFQVVFARGKDSLGATSAASPFVFPTVGVE
jgi:hypothetical protein